jgi:hypothetical protein
VDSITRLLHQSDAGVELAVMDALKNVLYHWKLISSLALMQKLGYLSRI